MNTTTNLKLLKKELAKLKIDYFLLPNSDEFMNEYLPESAKRLEFICGFTGSNAMIIFGQKKCAFFTDGRYTIQAAQEVDKKQFEVFNLSEKSPLKWILENAKNGEIIGFDEKLHSISQIHFYQKNLAEKQIDLKALPQNPVDKIWKNQPKMPAHKIFKHSLKYAGESSESKLKKIIKNFKNEADALILNSPLSICWLFNIRGSDILYTPTPLTYAIIYKNGRSEIFTNSKALRLKNVNFFPLKELEKRILSLKEKSVQIDFQSTNFWIYSMLLKKKIKAVNKADPCLILKACKNKIEIKNAIKAHEIDGLAVTKFLFWLENQVKNKKEIDEISAAKKLLWFRKQNKEFLYPSFETISGFGSNGAIVHYRVTEKTNKKFGGNIDSNASPYGPRNECGVTSGENIHSNVTTHSFRRGPCDLISGTQGLYLTDSGGQYFFGTTDITRTISIGTPTLEQKKDFTLVLKGHIALANAKFPEGTFGHDLDTLPRYHLAQHGKDYDHGTGHGVGSFLSVHEGPCSIGKRKNEVPLMAGMILSNEPGFYKENEYGIRIENLILVEKSGKNNLQFKTLTLAPLDPNLINFEMLNNGEKIWLKNYHQECYQKLTKKLTKAENNWVKNLTKIYQTQCRNFL